MKKAFALTLALLMLLTLVACGSASSNTASGNDTGSSQQEQPGNNNESPAVKKGNFGSAFEAIKKIEPKNTVEEINAIMGFEGELTDEENKVYCWAINDSEGIKVLYGKSDHGTIEVIANNGLMKQDGIDFSKSDELIEKVKAGIGYTDFIAYIGNVDGVMVQKDKYSVQYKWVSNDGSSMRGSFDTDGQCKFANALIN